MKYLILLLADWYKIGHPFQYPKGTTKVYSNFTSRKSRIPGLDKIIFFGLLYFIKRYLIKEFNETFFKLPLEEVLFKYKRRVRNSLPNELPNYDHIIALHNLQYLPICIKAVPEGTLVNMKVPSVVIYNTHDDFGWLPNFLETLLSLIIWKPSTSATIAKQYRDLLVKFARLTVTEKGDISFVNWQGHDFSMRGMDSVEGACTSGAGHLLSFWGTDTIPAIDFLEEYYNANSDVELIGGSIPATEHSVMCMGGKESEIETIRRLIVDVYPSGPVAIVSDTWDYFKTISQHALTLKAEIVARNGKVVFRPDSGVPEHIVAGYRDSEVNLLENGTYVVVSGPNTGTIIGEVEKQGSIEVLWNIFGGTTTDQGYKLLDEHVGCIYGDSITMEVATSILTRLQEKGFASFNMVFGIGSFTYQYNTRDTFGFAMKATAGVVEGEVREIFKDPITDDGTKKSAKGYLRVDKIEETEMNAEGDLMVTDYNLRLTDQISWEDQEGGLLGKVFEDGVLLREQSLSEIRNLINN